MGGMLISLAHRFEMLKSLVVPTICLYEVFKRVLIELGEDRALEAMGIMS